MNKKLKFYFLRSHRLDYLSNESGLGILQAMFVAALVLAISTGFLALSDYNKKNLNNQLVKLNAKQLTDTFFSLISDDIAWRNTTAANISMSCIATRTNCAAFGGGFTQFVPRGIDNTLFLGGYNPVTNPTQGFSPEGDLCNTYSTVTPSDRCPLRYTFWWRPICPAGPCVGTNIRIEIRAAHSPGPGTQRLNTTVGQSLYSTNFIRGLPDPARAAALCANFSKTWNPTLFVCN